MMGRWLLGGVALVLLAAPRPASAQVGVIPPSAPATTCTATVAGEPVSGHRSAKQPIHVRYDDVIRVEGQASSHVSSVRYQLKVAGQSVNFGDGFATNGATWSGDVRVKKYAWAGVGLYEVVGVANTDDGQCRDHVFICIDGKSPFATAPGGAATIAGIGGLMVLFRTLSRRRRDVAPLAIGGGLTALGGVVLMQQGCILPLTPLTMAMIPIGAFIGPIIGIAFGRGEPVPYTPPVAPPTPPEQPRTQSKNIYQFRAPSNSCNACRQHALNKVYAFGEAMKRAHAGCHCTIDWRPVDEASYAAYFRTGPEYDPRRTA